MEKITHLMPSVAFGETLKGCTDAEYRRYRDNFDALLKRPLTLPDLVPCVNGVPVEEPKDYTRWLQHRVNAADETEIAMDCAFFHEAKANSLFEGFEYLDGWIYFQHITVTKVNSAGGLWHVKKVEDLIVYGLPLTSKSIELIYGR